MLLKKEEKDISKISRLTYDEADPLLLGDSDFNRSRFPSSLFPSHPHPHPPPPASQQCCRPLTRTEQMGRSQTNERMNE
ncbi:hypothetical protein M0802_001088 [Mischocyttarus mexicanus]|nr:hypothetical protein M0802_001088 [Mischocyttarus mexicanus]